MKRTIGLTAVVVALVLSGSLAALAAGTFTDDDGNTHEANIEAIAAEDITKGCNPPDNTLYCPDRSVSRGEMAAFLVRSLGLTDDGGTDWFVDDETSTFEADINKLAAAGITEGCNPPENTEFCPDDPVIRGEMAAFLVRAFNYTDDGGGDLFIDDDDSIFEHDIDRLATAGVTKGCNPPDNTQFCPEDDVLRDQMASFLTRALGLDPIIPTADSCNGAVIDELNFDADGDDNANLNGEWVTILNDDTVALDFTDCTLHDSGPDHSYQFPDGFVLDPGESVMLFTGDGTDTEDSLYWGSGVEIWNNDTDEATLLDNDGDIVDFVSY